MASLSKNGARVGIREFRQNLAKYVLESDAPIVLTRHDDEVGYFIPVGKRRTKQEKEALKEAGVQIQKMLAAKGISEDEIVEDFARWRKAQRKR